MPWQTQAMQTKDDSISSGHKVLLQSDLPVWPQHSNLTLCSGSSITYGPLNAANDENNVLQNHACRKPKPRYYQFENGSRKR
jgi:hypothetical protein